MAPPLLSVTTEDHTFDVQFHPRESLLATATIEGEIQLHRYDVAAASSEKVRVIKNHEESCRAARFLCALEDGQEEAGAAAVRIASTSADCMAMLSDLESGERLWKAKLGAAGNALLPLDENRFVVGDDDGALLVFDVRQQKPTHSCAENEDFISDIVLGSDGESLCVASGDGTLAVYDLRKKGSLIAMSDFQEDEFLSLAILKGGKKVVCGSQTGILAIFTWGDFGDQKDRIKGHPMSVDAMVKISEDAVLTGSSDGKIRIVGVHHPKFNNCIVGRLGEHGSYPIEQLSLSPSGGLLASCSHAQPAVKLWSTEDAHSLLSGEKDAAAVAAAAAEAKADPDSDDSDEPTQKKQKRKKGVAKRMAAAASKSSSQFFNEL